MEKNKSIILYLLSIYFIIIPFYIFPSGLPQLADGIMVLIIIIYLINYNIKVNKVTIISIVLMLYIIVINSIWGIVFSSSNFLLSSSFYIFNIMTFIIIINLYRIYGDHLLRFVYYGVVCSIAIQVISSLFHSSPTSIRESLFFQNPNQLGYYALLSLGVLFLLGVTLNINSFFLFIFSIACMYLALLSLSNAAILSTFAMILLYFFIKLFQQKSVKYVFTLIMIVMVLIVGFSLFEETISSTQLYENVYNRIFADKYDVESNFQERRYDRITDYPQYLIFGAGEGLNNLRFGRGEIHSTIFGFLFSYGIIGFLILLIHLTQIIKKANLLTFVPLLSILMYGLTHNGIRQGLFWIILGLILLMTNEPRTSGDIDEKNKLLLRKSQ